MKEENHASSYVISNYDKEVMHNVTFKIKNVITNWPFTKSMSFFKFLIQLSTLLVNSIKTLLSCTTYYPLRINLQKQNSISSYSTLISSGIYMFIISKFLARYLCFYHKG